MRIQEDGVLMLQCTRSITRSSTIRLIVAALGCYGAVAMPTASAHAAPAPESVVTQVPPGVDQSVLAAPTVGPVLVRGTLTNGTGNGSVGKIAVLAWPDSQVLANSHAGNILSFPTIGWGTTDAQGNFTVRVDPALIPAGYEGSDGQLNVMLKGWTANYEGDWQLSVKMPSTASVASPLTTTSKAVTTLTATPTISDPVVVTLSQPLNSAHSASPTSQAMTPAYVTSCSGKIGVGLYDTGTRYYPMAAVNEGLTMYTNDWADATITSSHSVTVGSMESASGAYGSFHTDGSSTTSASFTVDWQHRTGLYKYEAQTEYARYIYCVGGVQEDVYLQPLFMTGGSQIASNVRFAAAQCAPVPKNSTFQRDWTTGEDFKWSVGVDLKGYVGVDTSVDTSWSTSHNVTYGIYTTTTEKICGNDNVPSLASRVEEG